MEFATKTGNARAVLILFLGNAILSDDRIGLVLGDMLKETLASEGYEVRILEKTGFSLLDYLENTNEVVIVDSIKTGRHPVGQIVPLNLDELKQYAPFTSHYAGIPEAVELMKLLDLNTPRHIHILGIEVEDPYTISDNISHELKMRLNELAQDMRKMISSSVHSAD